MMPRMKRLIAAMTIILAFTIPAGASARVVERPTMWQAHKASHMVLDDYAELIDGHAYVTGCMARGIRSIACRVTIAGPVHQRFRVLITPLTINGTWVVRARPLAA
jgi:hypothetical protein